MTEIISEARMPAPILLELAVRIPERKMISPDPAGQLSSGYSEVKRGDEIIPMEKWTLPQQPKAYLYPHRNDPL